MKLLTLSLSIGTMTCLQEGPLVIILILGFGFSDLLKINLFSSSIFLLESLSRSQEVDLVFPIFFPHFYFIFNLFSFIIFLELELGLEATRSCSHIAGHIR